MKHIMKKIKLFEEFNSKDNITESFANDYKRMSGMLKSKGFEFGEFESEHEFVSGNKYWRVPYVVHNGVKFEAGDPVRWEGKPVGKIEWLCVIDDGSVQVATSSKTLGRLDVEDIKKSK